MINTPEELLKQLMAMPLGHTFKIKENSYIRFKIIKAYQAKDFDGQSAGWEEGTPAGDRECIEVKTKENNIINYKNYWNLKTGIYKYFEKLNKSLN